jgi:Helitron helicase-like domain at N-terminus/PIF1-like helicase
VSVIHPLTSSSVGLATEIRESKNLRAFPNNLRLKHYSPLFPFLLHSNTRCLFYLIGIDANLDDISVVRTLAVLLRRNMYLCHDFRVALSRSRQPSSYSDLCKGVHNRTLHLSSLITLHLCGHRISSPVNLSRSFVTYRLLEIVLHRAMPNPIFNQLLRFLYFRFITYNATIVYDVPFPPTDPGPIGGGVKHLFKASDILPYICNGSVIIDPNCVLSFVDYVEETALNKESEYVFASVPFMNLIQHLPVPMLLKIARCHDIDIGSHIPKASMAEYFNTHECTSCKSYVVVFAVVEPKIKRPGTASARRSPSPKHPRRRASARRSRSPDPPIASTSLGKASGPAAPPLPQPTSPTNRIRKRLPRLHRKVAAVCPLTVSNGSVSESTDVEYVDLPFPPPPLNEETRKIVKTACKVEDNHGHFVRQVGRKRLFKANDLIPFLCDGQSAVGSGILLSFVDFIERSNASLYATERGYVLADVPLQKLVRNVPVSVALKIARCHNISLGSHVPKASLPTQFVGHTCVDCKSYLSVFECYSSSTINDPVVVQDDDMLFPPPPLSQELSHAVISGFCNESQPNMFEEAGCAVCGQLTPVRDLSPLKNVRGMLRILEMPGVTRIERTRSSDRIREFKGPVLDYRCNKICQSCRKSVRKGEVPKLALARGLWIGDVPKELSELRFVEKLLVARVRHNCCFVRVASGMRKMTSHVVAFQSPIPKIYQALPPPLEDLDEILAILFTGPAKPTPKDFERTPLLVRRNAVARALEWLKLNHSEYCDLDISYDNLSQYPEDDPPVSVEYRHDISNKYPESTSKFDDDVEDGTEEGDCPFVVHGLTGESLDTMTTNKLKGIALTHLNTGGKMLAVGHSSKLESLYHNPQLYPLMFPWLFPYGLGGVGSTQLSDSAHKRFLLMFHDKRFQTDVYFPIVAFSHAQIKSCTSGAFILADKNHFSEISDRLLSVDQDVMASLAKRMTEGENVKPNTQEERDCFQLIRDLDNVSHKVDGSVTSKKFMRSEIWSLMYYCGAPLWYITLSPADVKHPICIYYADTKETFNPGLREYDDRMRLIARNPVAGARFFHFMIELFIKHVLGVGTDHPGIYGETSAYYGTVEQQGRLTLHLHMLLWILHRLSPLEIRKRILDPSSDFQTKLIEYLESTHVGEFLTGSQDDIMAQVKHDSQSEGYLDPTQTLPVSPPNACEAKCGECEDCKELGAWHRKFEDVVDDLILKSNVHRCSINPESTKDGTQRKIRRYVGCTDNKWGKCKARFPRQVFKQTEVDLETGSLSMKKLESMINTLTPVVTYLFRCNTDITSLQSGTAIKGVILYVTDYITKCSLKTHVMFDIIRATYQRCSELIGGSESRKDKARRLMTKIVNNLSSKMEIGAPMASMYLLNNPDHYTNHRFATFYWKSYVIETRNAWEPAKGDNCEEKVTLIKRRDRIFGITPVTDYTCRHEELAGMCLYDWMRRCKREKLVKKKKTEPDYDESEECSSDDASPNHNKPQESEKTKTPSDTGIFQFGKEHPLHDTHGMRCMSEDVARIPNFVGETLPRRDQGDREWYCCTMLTLFRPWRSGLDLKTADQSWDESFLSTNFSKRQLQLMDNFHLRYECMDARDDFHAQLRKGTAVGPWQEYSNDEGNDTLSQPPIDPNAEEDMSGVEYEVDVGSSDIGKRELKRRRDIATMNDVMMRSGWTEPVSRSSVSLPPPPEFIKTGIQWKADVKKKRQEILERRAVNAVTTADSNANFTGTNLPQYDRVEIVDKTYLERKRHSVDHKKMIDDIVGRFSLNREQERAFRIVANHACNPASEQLKMYIGGMGGTGKTQVLKALVEFFNLRNESGRFVVVAPTGTAAALLRGSTYHYLFGFSERPDDDVPNKLLLQIRARLEGVSYIFLDEVSMLSCHDMYRISARLAKVFNQSDLPFGGMNMLFAGDFAQLPPAIGGEYAALYSRTVGNNSTRRRDQESAVGKALWHQVTTVVILRENMRQRSQTEDDARLRQALTNMRYKACNPDDISFLRSRISSNLPNRPSLARDCFRNVSIITALNIHKDEINRLGTMRFARETHQELVDFYSEDCVSPSGEGKSSGKRSRKSKGRTAVMTDNLQGILWNQPPSANDKCIPGKLSICIGMPVIVRNNSATELCITRGQEAVIYRWQSTAGSRGQQMLDTLFVKLVNPPQDVQFDGLPPNVVPLTRSTVSVRCSLPNDTSMTISRSQIEVLPNFAMTDYSSQGKTRPQNPVDLNNCRSHQSYYTALSRSASAAGTCIVQGFDSRMITGGASGALRQEFRELEILDDIVRLKYEGKLSETVDGDRRRSLIHKFRLWKGESYVPAHVHKAIRWGKSDPLHADLHLVDMPWHIVGKLDKQGREKTASSTTESVKMKITDKHDTEVDDGKIFAQPSNPRPGKRKLDLCNTSVSESIAKKPKRVHNLNDSGDVPILVPRGPRWINNSCAYDSCLAILHNIWAVDHEAIGSYKSMGNQLQSALIDKCADHLDHKCSLEDARDLLRQQLQAAFPTEFPLGAFVSVHSVIARLLSTRRTILSSALYCPNDHQTPNRVQCLKNCLLPVATNFVGTMQEWVNRMETCSVAKCEFCDTEFIRRYSFERDAALLAFDVAHSAVRSDYFLRVIVRENCRQYRLRGIIYFGGGHFVSRVITAEGRVWYHDGIATGSSMVDDGPIADCDLELCLTRRPMLYLYTLQR